jgi:peptidoglycan/LPS O-acetylase OafA/YrhL
LSVSAGDATTAELRGAVSTAESSAVRRTGWRSDIQGLRAVAVALVVLYHAAPGHLSGGYVGVDVFFVISGFLITNHLVGELTSKGSIGFAAFYARRIRRLLAPALVVLAATVIAAKIVLPPLLLPQIATDATASALYISNVTFAFQKTNYLTSLNISPVLHYWTLGVEEQFYLVWPVLLLVGAFAHRRSRGGLVMAMAVLAVVSLAASIWWTWNEQPFAFFLLPARAWEFALGGLVGLAVPRLRALPTASAAALTWIGMASILLPAYVFDSTTRFPGYVALAPVVGASLVIAGGTAQPRRGAEVLLGLRPLQAVGRVSYSLYLWHWPLIVLPVLALAPSAPSWKMRALVLLALPLAFATYRLVEAPPRTWRWLVRRPMRTYAFATLLTIAAISTFAAVGAVPRLDAGRPVRALPGLRGALAPAPSFVPANLTPSIEAAANDSPLSDRSRCALYFFATRPGACYSGDVSSSRTIVLFGDSHAAQWYPAIVDLAQRRRWRLLTLTKDSCPSVDVSVWLSAVNRMYTECDVWRRTALARIARSKPFAVILANDRSYGIPGVSRSDFELGWMAALKQSLSLLPRGVRGIVIADTPRFAFAPPVCLSRHLHHVSACASPSDQVIDATHTRRERVVTTLSGATFVDLTPFICPRRICEPIHGSLLVYRDTNHLTPEFVRALGGELDPTLTHAMAASGPSGQTRGAQRRRH